MNETMKDILDKMIKGVTKFECKWNGEPNVCTILKIDFMMSSAYVRFQKPVKRDTVKTVTVSFVGEVDEHYEVESYEEWIDII